MTVVLELWHLPHLPFKNLVGSWGWAQDAKDEIIEGLVGHTFAVLAGHALVAANDDDLTSLVAEGAAIVDSLERMSAARHPIPVKKAG